MKSHWVRAKEGKNRDLTIETWEIFMSQDKVKNGSQQISPETLLRGRRGQGECGL